MLALVQFALSISWVVDKPKFAALDVAAPLTEWALNLSISIFAPCITNRSHLTTVQGATGLCGLINAMNKFCFCSADFLKRLVTSRYHFRQATTPKSSLFVYCKKDSLVGGEPIFRVFVSFAIVNVTTLPRSCIRDSSREHSSCNGTCKH